jgi:hypothetical protein
VILTNTIPLPDVREEIQGAVLRAIGDYKTHEPWTAKIFAPADRAGYFIRINAPNGFVWEHVFEGPGQEAAGFIERTIRDAGLLRAAAEEAAKKLPEFAAADMRDREAMILTQVHRM